MKTRITITIEEKTSEQLKQAAAEQNRSLSNLVETILQQWVKQMEG